MEVFPEAKKMAQQYAVTTAKGVKWGIMLGEDEIKSGTVSLKNLATREISSGLTAEKAAEIIKAAKV